MPNRRRGDVALMLDGRAHTLRITLGALAELEDAFGAPDLPALAARFAQGRLNARDLAAILGAALRGGGHGLTDAEAAALSPDGGVGALAEALAEALRLAFEGDGPNPPRPQDGRTPSPGTTPSASPSASCGCLPTRPGA